MKDEYLSTGFTQLDEQGDIAFYSDCLSLYDSLPYTQQYKTQTYELLELSDDEKVLDAGCGLGEDVFRMSEIMNHQALVIGIDSSTKLIESAKSDPRNSPPLTDFCVEDVKQLSFNDAAFTRCRIDRALQHIPTPQDAIDELVRVLTPGGILLAYDNDWGSFTIVSDNNPITSLIEDAWCHSFTNSWIGKEQQALFAKAGLGSIKNIPKTSLINDFDTADKVYNITITAQRMVKAGKLTESESNHWIQDLKDRCATGQFSVSLTSYITVGRK